MTTLHEHLMWFWCWLCFKAYILLPVSGSHKTTYGLLMLWVLGYAGAYAHCTRKNFHLCRFFFRSDEEWRAAITHPTPRGGE